MATAEATDDTDKKLNEQVANIERAIKPRNGVRKDMDFTVQYLDTGKKVSTRERICQGWLKNTGILLQ
jgi:hypothetical protein